MKSGLAKKQRGNHGAYSASQGSKNATFRQNLPLSQTLHRTVWKTL